MALIEEPKKYPLATILWIGIPSFLIAAIISIGSHIGAHYVAGLILPRFENLQSTFAGIPQGYYSTNPFSALFGLIWTFILAIGSFAFFLHHPRNLFATSMAFINTALRLPEMVSVFLQFLFYNRTTFQVDESYSLYLLRITDPTLLVLFLCFFSLSMLFLLVIIVHDTKTIPWKWLVAIGCFIAITLMKNWMVNVFGFSTL
jgi:hypothetical protein